MKVPKGYKQGVVPRDSKARAVIICEKCGFMEWFFGSAQPRTKNYRCPGCILKKEEKKNKKKGRKVKRNPRVIKRNN